MPFETRVRISLAYPFCWLPSNCICHAWWQCWIEILPMSHVVVMHSGSEALWLCYRKWWVTVKFEIVRLNCSGIQESLRACANLEAKGSRGLRLPGIPWKPEGKEGGGKKKKKLELAGLCSLPSSISRSPNTEILKIMKHCSSFALHTLLNDKQDKYVVHHWSSIDNVFRCHRHGIQEIPQIHFKRQTANIAKLCVWKNWAPHSVPFWQLTG